jgi:hypothetical protein
MNKLIEKSIISDDGKKRKSVLVVCNHCNNKFWKEKRFANRNIKHFCNTICSNEYKRRNRKIFKCDFCGKDLSRKRSTKNSKLKMFFCNKFCKLNAQKLGLFNNKKQLKCMKCDNIVNVDSRATKVLCINCKPFKRKKNNYWDVINGNRTIKRANISFKNFLFNNNIKEEKCESCSLEEWYNKKIIFQLHHKDGNKHNNILENIEILCPNCHTMTDNWGFKKRK